jgi:hypothetical protein
MEQATKRGRGRPPKDPDLAVSHGISVQLRFPRVVYRQAAASREGFKRG